MKLCITYLFKRFICVDTLFPMLRVKQLQIKEGVMKFINTIQLELVLDTSLLHRVWVSVFFTRFTNLHSNLTQVSHNYWEVCSAFSKFNFVKWVTYQEQTIVRSTGTQYGKRNLSKITKFNRVKEHASGIPNILCTKILD